MTYFQRVPQRLAQWNPRRRNGHTDSGVVVVHTFEAPAGRTWQAGAQYLTVRTTHGSYHWLADAVGGQGHLAPWSAETWHETTVNNHAVGISMMTYANAWRKLTATQRRNLVHGAAVGAHRYSRWRVANGKSAVPARRISRVQAVARVPGFIGHGEIDTERRTDPGRDFPWDEFLAVYASLEAGGDKTTPAPITGPSARPDIEIQLALAVLGTYDPGPNLQYLDGINGDHQKAAVRNYQRSRGLHVDGWWGTNTNKHFEEHDMSKIVDQIATASAAKTLGWRTDHINLDAWGVARNTLHAARAAREETAALEARVAGLTEAVSQLARNQGVDPEAITAAIEEGMSSALDRIRVVVTEIEQEG